MISEKEFKNFEEVPYNEEPEIIKKEKKVEKIYEMIEQESIYDIFPTYDLQDERLSILRHLTKLPTVELWSQPGIN